MCGEVVRCICVEMWCECTKWILIDDFEERTEVACADCAKGNHLVRFPNLWEVA